MTYTRKRIAPAITAGLTFFWMALCQAQVYVQQSYGANSRNIINVVETRTLSIEKLQPEIRSIIRKLEREKSRSLRQIGDDFKEGRSDEALLHIHDALKQSRDDATRLAFLHYAAGHALLLSGMYTNAAKQVDLAVGLSPGNCRYRTSDAMMLIAAGRPWDAEVVVSPYNDYVQQCEKSNIEIDRALIHSVRAFVAANHHDESGTKNEMNAVDAILARMRPSDGIDDQYYEFQLNCVFAANAHQYWSSADELWPDASNRCQRWGALLNTKMPGARELARSAISAELIHEGTPAEQTYSMLSEQIREWSSRRAVPELGIDSAGRLTSLGSLYLARGMVNLWQLHKPAAAADDYRQAFSLLGTAAIAGRPSAVAELANVGFKITSLEEFSGEKVFPDSRSVLIEKTLQIADSSLRGDGSEACSALYWVTGLSRDLNSPATERLQKKRSECDISLQRDSIQQLTFTATVAEQDIDFYLPKHDDAKIVPSLDLAIASRMKLRGFPKISDNASRLTHELVTRAKYRVHAGNVAQSLEDADQAIEIATASNNLGGMASALNVKAYILGVSENNTAEALTVVSQAKQIASERYAKPVDANVSCIDLFQYADTFATEGQVQLHVRAWKSAEASLADLLKVLSSQKTCGDLRFDGKNDEQALTPVKTLLLIRTIDAATSLEAVRILETGTDDSQGKAEAFLNAAKKVFAESGYREVAWPITSHLMNSVLVH